MDACERYADLARTANKAKDRAEQWRQIVNAYSECYPDIIREVKEFPDRAQARAEELIRSANAYGFTVTTDQFRGLIDETAKQLLSRKAKKENPARDPSQKRVMKAADPVMMFNGQFVHDAQDVSIDGAGIRFDFVRTYKNQTVHDGPLGFNWDHNYNLRLRVSQNNVFRSTGGLNMESFVRHPNFGSSGFNYWAPPDGQQAVLIERGDSFVCRFPNGDHHVYELDPEQPFLHRITRIEDKHGNALVLSYAEGRLAQVQVNHQLRVVQLQYDDEGRIVAIEDYTGRRWCYAYDFFGDLVAVTAPQLPCGSTVRYEYSSVQSSGQLQHNLVRIIDAEGRFYLENEYGQEAGLLHFNRVIRQRLGGGDFRFEYEDFEEPLDFDYGDHERPAHVTTLVDRNGQIIRHVYNRFGNLLRKEQCICERGRPRMLVSRYRYNRDGALTTVLTSEGVVTQRLYGRDYFVRRFGARDEEDLRLHDELTVERRQGFGYLLATVERGRYADGIALTFSQGEWGDIAPDIVAPPAPADVVRKYTYEPAYGQLATISDPRFTITADPTVQSAPLEHPKYEQTLTRYLYRGPDTNPGSDPTLLLHEIVQPQATNPDGTPAPQVIERFPRYDARGRLLTHIDPDGVRTEYTYFGAGEMSTDGHRTVEGYLKKAVVDADGLANTVEYEVDALGRVILEHLPRAAEPQGERFVVRRTYDEQDRVTRTIGPDPFRFEVRRFYDRTGMLRREERDARDDAGQSFAGGIQVQNFEYDSELHTTMEARGGADPATWLVTRHCYDAAGRRALTILPNGSRIRLDYDERSLQVGVTRGAGTSDEATTRTEYDGDGRVSRTLSARGYVRAFVRDPFGRVVSEQDPLGTLVRRTFDKNGKVLVERTFQLRSNGTSLLVARTELEFDALGRRIRVGVNRFPDPLQATDLESGFVDSPGPGVLLTTQYFYDAKSRVRRMLDPLLRRFEHEYDGLGRIIAEREPLSNFSTNQYDRHSNLLRRDVFDQFVDPATGLPSQRVFSWTYEYDTLDRRTVETDGLGNATRYAYNSLHNVVTQQDALGNGTRYEYDIHGRRTAVTIARHVGGLGGGPPLPPAVTRYEYDANGNVTATIDALGRATRQEFDALGRRRALMYADGSRWSYEYDADSNPVLIRDANGLVRRITVDALGRALRQSVDAAHLSPGLQVGGSNSESFAYDALGRRVRTENDFAVTEVQPDSAGFAIGERLVVKGPQAGGLNTFSLKRQFSATGALMQLTYPGGRVVRFHRDQLNRLVRIENVANGNHFPGGDSTPDVQDIAVFTFAGRQILAATYGNGARVRRHYDGIGRTIEVSHTAGGSILLRSQQLYDAVNNLRLRNEADAGGERSDSFQFDSQRRLARIEPRSVAVFFDPSMLAPPPSPLIPIPDGQAAIHALIGPLAMPPGMENIDYDLVGNRVAEMSPNEIPIQYAVNQLNQYAARGPMIFSYDRNGNLTGANLRQYRYDASDRLVEVTAPGLSVQFLHDSLGRRVVERRGSETTLLVYDRDNLIAEYRDGALFAQYVYADGLDRPVQLAVRDDQGGVIFWLHADVTGSIRALTDQSAALAARYQYHPFGATLFATSGGPYNPLRFAGRRFDYDLASYDFRSRQFDPALGRFLQRDPLGMRGDTNLYTYADNNPLLFTDPLGTSRKELHKETAEARKRPASATPPPGPPETAPRSNDPADRPAPPPQLPSAVSPWEREYWADPDLAWQFLKDYNVELESYRREKGALLDRQQLLWDKRNEAIADQLEAQRRLSEIRRNDIWPNRETLHHVLIAGEVVASWYFGWEIGLIGTIGGAVKLHSPEVGAAYSIITECGHGPSHCIPAVALGAAGIHLSREHEEVTEVRRSARDEQTIKLDRALTTQTAIEAKLLENKNQLDELDANILFLRRMHDYAKYGTGDHPSTFYWPLRQRAKLRPPGAGVEL